MWYAPPSDTARARRPRSTPSASAATSTSIRCARACDPAARLSRRSSTHLTGRPSTRAAAATATSSGKTCVLRPKPPPTSGAMTRTRVSGRSSAAASAASMMDGVWVEAHTVSDSPSQSTRTPRGSRGDGAQRPCSNVSRSTRGAPANAPSTSPRRWWRRKRTWSAARAVSIDTVAGSGSSSTRTSERERHHPREDDVVEVAAAAPQEARVLDTLDAGARQAGPDHGLLAAPDPRQDFARDQLELLHPPVERVQHDRVHAAVERLDPGADPLRQLLGFAEQVMRRPVLEVHAREDREVGNRRLRRLTGSEHPDEVRVHPPDLRRVTPELTGEALHLLPVPLHHRGRRGRMRHPGIGVLRDAPEHGVDVRHGLAVDLLERLRAAADPDRRGRPRPGPRVGRGGPGPGVPAPLAPIVARPQPPVGPQPPLPPPPAPPRRHPPQPRPPPPPPRPP